MANHSTNSSGGRSLKAKGMATRSAILDAAHDVFKTTGYYSSSISGITRRCGVSMGTFYQYFKNKEQVFLELNDLIISRFMNRAAALELEGSDLQGRLHKSIQLLYRHSKENFAFHKILGESELIDRVTIGYYEAIARFYRNFFRQESQRGTIRPLDPNVIAYGLIGICYFNSLDWAENESDFSSEQIISLIVDLTLNGISGTAPWKQPVGWEMVSLPDPLPLQPKNGEPLTKGEKTRRAIFAAAEGVFGTRGVNRGNIAEITQRAGVAQGTFYLHFDSKRDLVEGFVKYINQLLRQELQRFASAMRDRRDAERVGMLAFYDFIRLHRGIYRIVPEFEMIGREVGLWYYKKLAVGYLKGIEQGIEKGEIRSLPAAFLVKSLMGLTHFIGLKWIIWVNEVRARIPSQVLQDILDFVFFGLKVDKNRK
jgi:AcrR family transcriptional regulator